MSLAIWVICMGVLLLVFTIVGTQKLPRKLLNDFHQRMSYLIALLIIWVMFVTWLVTYSFFTGWWNIPSVAFSIMGAFTIWALGAYIIWLAVHNEEKGGVVYYLNRS